MIAEFDEAGTLVIKAETHTEQYALSAWGSRYMNPNNNEHPSAMLVDTRGYLAKSKEDKQ